MAVRSKGELLNLIEDEEELILQRQQTREILRIVQS